MNILAHLHLSFGSDDLIIGNFVTDLCTSKQWKELPSAFQKGVELHHFIDNTTDSHPVFRATKSIFSPKYNHYSGVIVDIVYDHFLARKFNDYHNVELNKFVSDFYQLMDSNIGEMPERVVYYYGLLRKYNWLTNYHDLNELAKVFKGMDGRTKFKSGMSNATDVLVDNYIKIEEYFDQFYPELFSKTKKYCEGRFPNLI
ncbi:MAG: ACP phosphodiesterase [Marinifilaceae bacterium]|jgi:acyl carrier protein phosphodiesterase|nr:ACP phosphodiesterase [Marinifilaceae bacterium]